MESDRLVLDDQEIDDLNMGLEKQANGVVAANDKFNKDFAVSVNSGLMGPSIKAISGQLNAITESISNINNSIKQYKTEMVNFDNEMSTKAESVEIPQDFVAENALEVNKYNRVLLEKLDGKSVNEGEAQGEAKDIDESVVAAQGLVDITKDDTKEQALDESTVIGRSTLGNIVKDETKEQAYDETSKVNAKALGDINNGNNQAEQTLDETTVIGRSVLGNVNGGSGAVAAAAVADYNASVELDKQEKEKMKEEQQKTEEELVRPDFEELIPSEK